MDRSQKYKFNIVILGQGAVGKSSLVSRFHSNEFTTDYVPTLQDTFKKTITIQNKQITLEILDTAGQEDYKQLLDIWIEEGDGFLLCYAVDSQDSFEEVDSLRRQIVQIKSNQATIFLVGTKADRLDESQVESVRAQEYAKSNNIGYVQTSSRTGLNCQNLFEQVALELINKQDQKKNQVKQVPDVNFIQKLCSLI